MRYQWNPYLQQEPMLAPVAGPIDVGHLNDEAMETEAAQYLGLTGGPRFVLTLAKQGRVPPAYAYAFNNPLRFIDPDGRGPKDIANINCKVECGLPVEENYQYCLGDVSSGDPKNKKKRTKDDCKKARDKLINQCNSKCDKEHPLPKSGGGGACP